MNLFLVLLAATLSLVHPALGVVLPEHDSKLNSASNDTCPFASNDTCTSASNVTCPSYYNLKGGELTVNGKLMFNESKLAKIIELTELSHDYAELEIHDLPLSMQDIAHVNELFHNKLTSVMLERVIINDSTGYFDFSKCKDLKKLHIIQSTVHNQLQNSLQTVSSKLKDVDFTANIVNEEIIELLKKHEISELNLTACGLRSFPAELMAKLERLNLCGNPIGIDFVDMVKDYPGKFAIIALDLSSTELLNFKIRYLLKFAKKFPKISFLNIASNGIYLDSLKGIQSVFPSLEYLQLSHVDSYKKMSDFLQILNENNSSVTFPVRSPARSSARSVKIYSENRDECKPPIDFISQLNIIANPNIQSWRNFNGIECFPSFDTIETSFDTVIKITFSLRMFPVEDIKKLSALTFPKLTKVRFNYYGEKDLLVLQSLLQKSPIANLHLYVKIDEDLPQLVSALQIKNLKLLTISLKPSYNEQPLTEFFTMFFDKIQKENQECSLESLHINADIGNSTNSLLGALSFFPALKSLEVASENLDEFSTTQSFPNLERLSIGFSSKMYEDEVSSKFVVLFPNLSHLELSSPSNSHVLSKIVESCKNLQEISLKTYFTSENDDALLSLSKLPMITDIVIVENLVQRGNFIWDNSIKDKFNHLISFGCGYDHEAIKKLKESLEKRNVTQFYQTPLWVISSLDF